MKYHVTFLPSRTVAVVEEGTTIIEAANWAGLPVESTCGGRGSCGKCKVRVSDGRGAGEWRLACRTKVQGDCLVDVPRVTTALQMAPAAYGRSVAVQPVVHKVYLELAEPTLSDQRSDLERLTRALEEHGYEVDAVPAVWRELPVVLRSSGFCLTTVFAGGALIAVEPGNTTARNFGVALDLGTTTVSASIVDLSTGAVLARGSALNLQAACGADVITRISHAADREDGLARLQRLAVETIQRLTETRLSECGVNREEIYEIVAVGNPTMLHLLLGISPAGIGQAPFVPVLHEPVTVRAADTGLRFHPEALLSTLPHLGAYVGSDIIAGLLATNLLRMRERGLRLYIDVGTNGEIVLTSDCGGIATAAPAGPAFEGAGIRCGMMASTGAIEGVEIRDGAVRLRLVGNATEPVGICGSGLVSVVAELLRCGLVDRSGRLAGPECAGVAPERMVEVDGMRAFRLGSLDSGIVITQMDIRALQLAKAAVAAGTAAVLAKAGAQPGDLQEVLLAGAFGSFIDPASARAIGLVPWLPLDRISAVGNAASAGATLALISYRERQAANEIAKRTQYLELSGVAEFDERFTESLAFPEPQE